MFFFSYSPRFFCAQLIPCQWREAHLRTKSGGGVQLVKREQGVKGPWVAMGGYGWLWVAMGDCMIGM